MNDAGNEATKPHAILSQLMEMARVSALAELASGIAHEINQPLGAIATFAQAADRMLNKPAPMIGQTIDVLHQIHQQALDAGASMRRIRRLFDREQLARTACRMSDLVGDLKPVLDFVAKSIHGRVDLDVPDEDFAVVNVDCLSIQHVLFVLFQNACDACGSTANPVIRLSVRQDRYGVETSVVDPGPGVPTALKDQVFRPFFTTKPRGTGLGLASCRAIIEAHGGTMGFENLATGGCRFWFRLPAAS